MELTPENLAKETLKKRLEDCNNDLVKLMEKHSCALRPEISITPFGILPIVNIVDNSPAAIQEDKKGSTIATPKSD